MELDQNHDVKYKIKGGKKSHNQIRKSMLK
jgi:hypothetical protein